MSINNLESKIEELKELENFMAEINEQAEAIRGRKGHVGSRAEDV